MLVSSSKSNGFTLIELMVVIAIIGILAMIAIPNFVAYKKRSYYTVAKSDGKNAYTAAQAYYNDYPSKNLSTMAELEAFGFKKSALTDITVSGEQTELLITVKHSLINTIFSVDSDGNISPPDKFKD